MTNIIELREATFVYPDGNIAIDGINLEIPFSGEGQGRGHKMVVLGSNGSGKTTLFLLLNGIHKITSGEGFFKGKPFQYNSKSLLELRKSVGIVFQDPDTQIFSASVREEIAFGLFNLGHDEKSILKQIEVISEKLHISHLLNKPTHFLSYGEKKRVSLASILVMEPEVLILDEPAAGLDPVESLNLVSILDQICAAGKTIIVSTHNVNFAYSWADNIIVLKKGKIIKSGSPVEIFRDNKFLKTGGLEMPDIEELIHNTGLAALFKNTVVTKRILYRTIKELFKK